MADQAALQPILEQMLDGRTKGFPQDRAPVRLGDVGGLGLRLLAGELDFPAAVLRRSALEHNARWMGEFIRRTGASLCPHGKTTMAPQLFHRQLADGAWGITLATAQEARIAYSYGVRRVLLANEVVLPAALRWIGATLDRDPAFELMTLVDSRAGVAALEAGLAGARPLPVLVELGIPGGRGGARTLAEGLELARAVRACGRLRLCGVECFEGIVGSQDPEADRAKVDGWLAQLAELAVQADREGLFETDEILYSAGGSAYFDLVVRNQPSPLSRPVRTVLRSGCYFSHDVGHYKRLLGLLEQRLPEPLRVPGQLRPALEIWGQVVSRPEPGLAFVGMGKRDVSHDIGLPVPVLWARPGAAPAPQPAPESWRVVSLYDQHARLELPADAPLQPGDLVGFGISHPCTAFDKWQVLFEVDDDYRVLGAVRTFF
jgi:D-serine dehydratase